jgi:hypothetical protein
MSNVSTLNEQIADLYKQKKELEYQKRVVEREKEGQARYLTNLEIAKRKEKTILELIDKLPGATVKTVSFKKDCYTYGSSGVPKYLNSLPDLEVTTLHMPSVFRILSHRDVTLEGKVNCCSLSNGGNRDVKLETFVSKVKESIQKDLESKQENEILSKVQGELMDKFVLEYGEFLTEVKNDSKWSKYLNKSYPILILKFRNGSTVEVRYHSTGSWGIDSIQDVNIIQLPKEDRILKVAAAAKLKKD